MGDIIGIVSPASPIAAFCPKRLQRGADELKRMGFEVIIGAHATARTGHTAGTIEQRTADLHEMFANPQVKGIITTVGGFNSHQLLENLDYEVIRKNPKVFMGYSDITALLAAIHHLTGLVTFMGPAILPQFGEFDGLFAYTKRRFQSVLMEAAAPGLVPESEAWTDELLLWDAEDSRRRRAKPNPGMRIIKPGDAEGPILAANAGTLLLLAGTKYFPDVKGRILCLEDDDGETPASIDRYFTHLRQLGVFEQIRGLVVGRFHSKVPFTSDDPLTDILLTSTRGYDFPIVTDADFGHTDPMMVLPNGIRARLTALEAGPAELHLLESAVV